ncbi:carboxypeptidase-like regulatory domain-containing protein [Tamlana sp. I1]|uniref:carboxypeptidase-like regulatory domain-containing protein n=1 Tax=Tamlana sp. I1 TaxID=2762061 RepID=UPI0018907A77|nr:carboxypeptidase-like regulatory domain-containing protein [Tamlana sp. I1]
MKYKIKIPKPCNEKWNEMSRTEKGAFCSNCKKEVIDFTNMSNYQLAKFLENTQNLCGKFKNDQLDINISTIENNKYQKAGLLLGVLSSLSIVTPTFAQNKSNETIKSEQYQISKMPISNNNKTTDSTLIHGTVFYEEIGLPGVNVILKGKSYGVQTDFDGNFTLEIAKNELNQHAILVFNNLGFETQEIKITSEIKFLKIKMIEDEILMGEVIVIKNQNIFRKFGNLFRKKENNH